MYEDIKEKAANAFRENKELIRKLKLKPPSGLDNIFRKIHEKVFGTINCLDCANCCKTLGPRITDKDINRISSHVKLKPSVFTTKYLQLDEDGDYIFKGMPCPFLRDDNYCSIYDQRPSACRDYPHTNRNRVHQVLDLTLKNSFICPGVLEILERVRD